ncbi:uncharacterized protein LOC123258757 isoform X2 [Cotesia glomerata]|uniref:uncharacterized protein LOC123258757 isoform X2 n=1 Tax=Cotesia glomerata TaxID=32391 RepID=UPI001D0284D5|nr:uncharacterized protein LOC123258757 isoform X2 [Cotesia glomerata]
MQKIFNIVLSVLTSFIIMNISGKFIVNQLEIHYFKNIRKYFKCIYDNSKIKRCNGGGVMIDNNFTESKKYRHNHSRNLKLADDTKFCQTLRQFSRLPFVKPKQVVKALERDEPEVTSSLMLSTLRKRVQRSIKKENPVNTNIKLAPKNLMEFGRNLESSTEELKYGLHKEMQLTAKLLTFQVQTSKREVKEATVILMYDADYLEEISPFVEVISTDATFNSFPDLHVRKGQLMTVMVQLRTDNDCQKAIPCTWVLMNNKSTDCYLQVFQFLADNFKNFRPKYSMTDYEIALRNSLKEVFPGIQTKTCYFHYSQALIKNAQEKKLIDKDNNKEERPELFIFLNRLKLLALLPAEFIESVYEKIEKECLNDFGDYFRDYLNYYEKQWLKQEGAAQISVYKLRNRTNNFLESYHKQLNTFLSKRPKHNVFVGLVIVSLEPTHHTKPAHT